MREVLKNLWKIWENFWDDIEKILRILNKISENVEQSLIVFWKKLWKFLTFRKVQKKSLKILGIFLANWENNVKILS